MLDSANADLQADIVCVCVFSAYNSQHNWALSVLSLQWKIPKIWVTMLILGFFLGSRTIRVLDSPYLIFVSCKRSAKCFCYFLVQTCGFRLRKHHPFTLRFQFTVRLQHTVAAAMATADMTALPLQQFIASLDSSCLPRILQVCSGVYFQGKPIVWICSSGLSLPHFVGLI